MMKMLGANASSQFERFPEDGISLNHPERGEDYSSSTDGRDQWQKLN